MISEKMEHRIELARRVCQWVFDSVESVREDNIGANAFYLLLALLDDLPDSYVDWSDTEHDSALAVLLQNNPDLWEALLKEGVIIWDPQ